MLHTIRSLHMNMKPVTIFYLIISQFERKSTAREFQEDIEICKHMKNLSPKDDYHRSNIWNPCPYNLSSAPSKHSRRLDKIRRNPTISFSLLQGLVGLTCLSHQLCAIFHIPDDAPFKNERNVGLISKPDGKAYARIQKVLHWSAFTT